MKIQEIKNIIMFMLVLVFIVAYFNADDEINKHLFSALSVIIGAYTINHLSNPKQIKNE